MPNLQFMEQFAPAIFLGLNPHEIHVQGAPLDTPAYAPADEQIEIKAQGFRPKRQTIRRIGGTKYSAGDTLYLFINLRRDGTRKLGEVRCNYVRPVALYPNMVVIEGEGPVEDVEAFARADGFQTYAEMCAWFKRRYAFPAADGRPFTGQLIKW